MADSSCSYTDGERFRFTTSDDKAVTPSCENGTAWWDVGVGGACAPVNAHGQAKYLTMYHMVSLAILIRGFGIVMRDATGMASQSERPLGKQQQQQIDATTTSMTADQRVVLMMRPPRTAVEQLGRWRAELDRPNLAWAWLAASIVVPGIMAPMLGNQVQVVLSLSESNAISDVESVTSVIKDICEFFEDGMAILIGAALGAGDPTAAGTLTLLGYLAGLGTGVMGSGMGVAAALSPWLMDLVIPAPQHLCAEAAGVGAGGALSSEGELQEIAWLYWMISVWAWPFKFCNLVGRGVLVGTNSFFDIATSAIIPMVVSIISFFTFVAVDRLPNVAAVALSNLTGTVTSFFIIGHAVFRGPVSRLVPLPSRAALASSETTRLALVAARSGAAMMMVNLAGQVQGTTTTQLLARMGAGLQYRATILYTITGNLVYGGFFDGAIKLAGAKYWGAQLRFTYWYYVYLFGRATLVLGCVGSITMALFYDSAPWAFASSEICSLLQHPCGVAEYEELYGNDFELTYWIQAVLVPSGGLAGFLSYCLYAAQEFDFVSKITIAGLVLFGLMAVLAYHLDSFLLLQLAGSVPTLLTGLGCGWRLHRLWQQQQQQQQQQHDDDDDGRLSNSNLTAGMQAELRAVWYAHANSSNGGAGGGGRGGSFQRMMMSGIWRLTGGRWRGGATGNSGGWGPVADIPTAHERCCVAVDLIPTWPPQSQQYLAQTLAKDDGVETMTKVIAYDTGGHLGWQANSDEFKQTVLAELLATGSSFRERLLAGAAAAGIDPTGGQRMPNPITAPEGDRHPELKESEGKHRKDKGAPSRKTRPGAATTARSDSLDESLL